jgi:hypothetical protein
MKEFVAYNLAVKDQQVAISKKIEPSLTLRRDMAITSLHCGSPKTTAVAWLSDEFSVHRFVFFELNGALKPSHQGQRQKQNGLLDDDGFYMGVQRWLRTRSSVRSRSP